MKTTILTTAIFFATVFGISQSSFAATNKKQAVTVLSEATAINKIEVHGNVELYLTAGTTDKVKVYDDYYAQNALVQDQNGVLNISSYTAKKLVVWVTASDLRSLAVYDNAEVKSFDKVSAIELNINLFDTASANLDLDTFEASVTLHDSAKADLSGNINEADLHYGPSSVLNTTGLVASYVVHKPKAEISNNIEIPELASL